MSFANDWNKLLILEVRPGKQLNALTWTVDSTPTVFYHACDFGEIVSVEEDGVALTLKTNLADCRSTASSFYHDFFGGVLYVHLSGGGDPGEYISPDYVHDVIAYAWKCISNRQGENGETIDYIPEGCVYPHFYDPALKAGTLSELTAAIADHFESAMQTSFGGISIVNDLAGWYADVDNWYWSNADARVRIGSLGDLYAALEKVFVGRVNNPEVTDEETSLDLVDTREGRLQSIPPDHFNLTTYPNLNPDADGKPIPILFGDRDNLSPVRIDITTFKFKISATHFNSGADVFEMQSIDAVYHKGIALSVGSQYTADLHNGEFTLLFDPGDGEVTCDAKGIKNAFNMATGAATGVFSENVADHLFFILKILNRIAVAEIDLQSFSDLQTQRTQAVAWYLDQDTGTLDFNRLLQQTSLYHFLPLANGTFAARYYRKTVPAGTLELRDWDHAGYKKRRPSEGVFRDIFLKYDKDPTTGIFKQLVHTQTSTESRHKTKEPYEVQTALRDASEAATVLAFYVALLKDPPTKIETSISMIGRTLIPTDKLYNNRSVVADGHEVIISTDEVYVILEAMRNFEEGRVTVKAQLDTQLAIYTQHADSPHQDVPHEDHSDVIHTDAEHGDDYTDAYTDIAHIDYYADAAYTDFDHGDHQDGMPHEDWPHIDEPHADAYADNDPHIDFYTDIPHVDTGHVDHTDTVHTDAHTDVSHIDSEV